MVPSQLDIPLINENLSDDQDNVSPSRQRNKRIARNRRKEKLYTAVDYSYCYIDRNINHMRKQLEFLRSILSSPMQV